MERWKWPAESPNNKLLPWFLALLISVTPATSNQGENLSPFTPPPQTITGENPPYDGLIYEICKPPFGPIGYDTEKRKQIYCSKLCVDEIGVELDPDEGVEVLKGGCYPPSSLNFQPVPPTGIKEPSKNLVEPNFGESGQPENISPQAIEGLLSSCISSLIMIFGPYSLYLLLKLIGGKGKEPEKAAPTTPSPSSIKSQPKMREAKEPEESDVIIELITFFLKLGIVIPVKLAYHLLKLGWNVLGEIDKRIAERKK